MNMNAEDRLTKRRIARYALPDASALARNKVNWPVRVQDCALVIHDMQNFWLGFYEDCTILLANVARLRALCKQYGMPVVYTQAEKPKALAERALGLEMWGPGMAAGHLSDDDRAICSALAPAEDDYVVRKPRDSGFLKTDLDDILQRTNRKHILLTGVFAHHGVLLTAADAYMRNIKVSLVVDAIADYSLRDHEITLDYVAEVCGALTTTALAEQELIASVQDERRA
jgi:bifunctional isochorismate lyase/aryl carrier protein